jgi:transposase-like protein
MPTSYPAEFRRRAIALVRSGWSVTKTAHDLDITTTTIYNWVKQDRIDRGEIPGVYDQGIEGTRQGAPTHSRARDRSGNLAARARTPRKGRTAPKRAYPVIDTLVGAGFKVKKCCEVLGVSSAGYYLAKTRPMPPCPLNGVKAISICQGDGSSHGLRCHGTLENQRWSSREIASASLSNGARICCG